MLDLRRFRSYKADVIRMISDSKSSVISFVVLLLAGTICSAKGQTSSPEKSFHFSSVGTGFGVQGEFLGTYVIDDDAIRVNVTRAMIYVSEHCPYQGRRGITQISFGLATATSPNGAWKTETTALPTQLGIVMRPKEQQVFYGLYFSIPKKKGIDLSKRWFVVNIEDEILDPPPDKPEFSGRGSCFAHSCKNIFAESEDKAMRESSPEPKKTPRTCT